MKKLFLTLALAIVSFTVAYAQFGVVGGFTSSKTKIDGTSWADEIKSASLWHAGVAYRIDIGPLFTLQPALVYQTKGSVLESNLSSLKTNSGYVELELGAQLGIDLLAFRPFFLLEPFIGYQVVGNDKIWVSNTTSTDVNKYLNDAKNKLEVGFGIGGGIEILKHIQVSVQWFMNVGKLYNEDKLAVNNLASVASSGYKDIKNYQGIKVGVGIFF